MADQFSNNKERTDEGLKSPALSERHEGVASQPAGEIKKTTEKFIEGVEGTREAVEGAEIVEFAEGHVGEEVKEDKKNAPGGGGALGMQAGTFDLSQIVLPSIEIMRTQIALKIKKEIYLLEREAAKIMSIHGQFSPLKLNGLVAKIRELKDILAHLAYAGAEALKSWWLKFVRGITI